MNRGRSGPKSAARTVEWMPSAPTSRSAETRAPFVNARLHAIAVIGDAGEPVPETDPLARQRVGEDLEQIRAMEVVVGRAEGRLDRLAEGRPLERAPVVPAPLVDGDGTHSSPIQRLAEPQPAEQA